MHTDEYITFIEELTDEEVNLVISPNFIKKLANRAKLLEKETDFTLDDIVAEFADMVKVTPETKNDWDYFIGELATVVFDEIVSALEDVEDEEYFDEEE